MLFRSEVMEYLHLSAGMTVLDCTTGTGGHSQGILERIMPGGFLIGLDRDKESLSIAQNRLERFGSSCKLVHSNFVDLDTQLAKLNIDKVDAVLFDLGVSSYQLRDPDRGFSFQNEGPLDMRMDRESQISAYDLVNNLNEEEISELLSTFGQERWHNRIARIVVEERQKSPITTTQQLANIVYRAIPVRFRNKHYRIHPATRTFQAVRIAVNRELEIIDESLAKAINVLKTGARISVISFHSLEDRVVKWHFRKASAEGRIEIKTKKPIVPGDEEISRNHAARSSKLRVAEKRT